MDALYTDDVDIVFSCLLHLHYEFYDDNIVEKVVFHIQMDLFALILT